MTIDERLASTGFPLPAIREVNLALHPTGISLGLGELRDFETDSKITESLIKSLNKNGMNYCPNAGLPELRYAIANAHGKEDENNYTDENVIITVGVQNAIYSTVKTLKKLGAKRILIPEINFGIYKKIPLEFGLKVETYRLNPDYGIDIDHLKNIINEDDIVIINSPANPTGRVLDSSEQTMLSKLFREKLKNGYVISDEIYGKLVYEGEPFVPFSCFYDRVITVSGISKSGASAGLRVGWIITNNKFLAKAIVSNNATIISAPPTANQYAAIPVVTGETAETLKRYNEILKNNRNNAIEFLKKMQIPYVKPRGSFYIFADLKSIVGEETKRFCIDTAKKENGVVVIPGGAFGANSKIRISLATLKLIDGMKRLTEAVKSYTHK
ncbi:MAG: pyridoxal phosphate-dependent aminotransferase [Chlorobi bacterium]|nr:pyridoxal phosphate-dependent aminotransferase [Chlorobiota bacterium]